MLQFCRILIPLALWLLPVRAVAGLVTAEDVVAAGDGVIPDGNLSGIARVLFTTAEEQFIQNVSVTVTITPISGTGWSGDLYLWLRHDASGRLAVLMNRVGAVDPADGDLGAGGNGLDRVTFDDQASTQDIHNFAVSPSDPSAPITGFWAADGRAVSPLSSNLQVGRSALLSNLSGLTPNSSWTLFAVDASGGNPMQLKDWSVSVTTRNAQAVPEAGGWTAGTAMTLLVLGTLWRRRCARA
jgi:hypothetical protein